MADKEYIERGALKQKKVYSLERHEYVVPVAEIDWMPAADVVEVVRCKDCKHWTPMDDGISWNNRGRADGRCKMLENMHYSERGLTNENHFCSYGERKEQT